MSPWPALEQSHRLRQVAAVWRRHLGETFTAFQAAFLQRTPDLAASHPCPRDCGCAHEVIREGPDDFAAVCRCERWSCDTFAVTPDQLALWELGWTRLGRALCQALGLDTRPAALGLPNTWQIGSWSTAAVPALFTIPAGPDDLRRAIAELAARLRRPYILVAPTTRHLTVAGLELLASTGADFFDLESHVAFAPAGSLRAVKAPGELFSRFTPEPPQEDRSVVERAFALVKALGSAQPLREPSVVATFSHYCLDGLNVSQIARKFRCSRGTVLNRLDLIRRRTGTDPDRFRRVSPSVAQMDDRLSDPRARRIYRKGAVYGDEEEEE